MSQHLNFPCKEEDCDLPVYVAPYNPEIWVMLQEKFPRLHITQLPDEDNNIKCVFEYCIIHIKEHK